MLINGIIRDIVDKMIPLINESLDFIFLSLKKQQFKALLEQYFYIKRC